MHVLSLIFRLNGYCRSNFLHVTMLLLLLLLLLTMPMIHPVLNPARERRTGSYPPSEYHFFLNLIKLLDWLKSHQLHYFLPCEMPHFSCLFLDHTYGCYFLFVILIRGIFLYLYTISPLRTDSKTHSRTLNHTFI